MPATLPVQDRVDVPDPPTIDAEVRVHDRFVELVVTARVIVPTNELTGAIVIVEVPATPTFTLTLGGPVAMVKS